MIFTVVKKEFTELMRDGRFRWSALIVFALLVVSLVVGWQHSVVMNEERAAAQDISRRQWVELPAMNPHSAAHYSIFAFKPVAPLALADTGIDPFSGVAVWLEAHSQNEATYSAARDSTAAGRFGQLTAATVLQILIPLVIILLTFAAFAGEREQGTLRQVLSSGAARSQLAFGKVLGAALALAVILVPAVVFGAAALALSSETVSFALNLTRFSILVLAYSVYFAVFLTISLAVSALASSSRLALIILLAFWSFNLILPRLAADLGRAWYPTPSALEFKAAIARDMTEGIDGHNPYDARGEQLKQKLLQQYNVTTIDELPINFEGVALQESEDYGNRAYERRYGDLWRAYENQNRLHTLAGIVTPIAAVRSVSMSLAGSDWHHHRHFAESSEEYRRMLVKRMNDEVTYNSHSRDYEKNVRGRELYEEIPDFEYHPPPPTLALSKQRLTFGLLAAWLLTGFLALGLAVKRMKVDIKNL